MRELKHLEQITLIIDFRWLSLLSISGHMDTSINNIYMNIVIFKPAQWIIVGGVLSEIL